MKTLNEVLKNMGKVKIIGIIVALVVIIGGVGGFVLSNQKSQAETFTPTPNIMEELAKPESKNGIVVFYSNGSDYSKAGAIEMLKEVKNAKVPVYFVDFDSPQKTEVLSSAISNDAISQDDISKINTATMIISVSTRQNMDIIQYADNVDGKYIPLKDNIKKAFEGN